jgi:hypothetical protein
MARPRKILDPDVLKNAYLSLGMSTPEISRDSERLFGTHVTAATVYHHLTRLGIRVRNKSDSIAMAKGKKAVVKLTDVAGRRSTNGTRWNTRYWNAKWLIMTGKVKATKSKLTTDQAALLSRLLDEYGDKNALPEDMVETAFNQARIDGFPYIVMNEEERIVAWNKLRHAVLHKNDGYYYWTGSGTTLATMFHPHIYECRKLGKMSPLELFNSDEDLRRAIRKAYCLYGKINKRVINDICRNEDAAGRVGNFPPRVGMSILHETWPGASGLKVLDPCAGFGGRMLSCAASGKVNKYVGIDLSSKTHAGLVKMRDFLSSVGCPMEMDLRHGDCTSEIDAVEGQFDLVMTSPPFLDIEEYVGVPSPHDYGEWLSSFVRPLVRKCSGKLRAGGKIAIYMEKVRSFNTPGDFRRIASEEGLVSEPSIFFKMNYGASKRIEYRGIEILVWSKQIIEEQ